VLAGEPGQCDTVLSSPIIIYDYPQNRIDAFIGPGHVSTVIGCRPYEWIARHEGKPIVVSGFEPLDVLQSVVMIVRQMQRCAARVENPYRRVVPWDGNRAALKVMTEVFTLPSYFEWRGMCLISQSALALPVLIEDGKLIQCG
jgi:hydrogenase expression/formation protein HypD